MAEHGRRDVGGQKSEPEIAPADLLFGDDQIGRSSKPGGMATPVAGEGEGEVFELADSPAGETTSDAAPMPVAPAAARPAPRTREASRPRPAPAEEMSREDAEARVDEVWSRTAEWGPNLVVVAGWLFALAVVVYLLLGWEMYGPAFLLLLLGLAGAVVLCYPMMITLERPVRMTPEQAVRDFYGALSHHLPHYRRMWLLLARPGRTAASYGSFEGFKAYWNEKIKTIKGSRVGAMTPLVFEIENFRGDKSAGKSRVDVKYTLKIFVRGKRQDGPIASLPAQLHAVRGPDKMWYLESGTLPHGSRDADAE